MSILGRSVSEELLSKVDWGRYVHDLEDWSDIRALHYHRLMEVAAALRADFFDDEAAVVQLIAAAVSMRLQPESPSSPFLPLHRGPDSVSPAIEDFDEEDVACLSWLIGRLDDLWLKARLADVACTAGQAAGLRVWQWGRLAATTYLDHCEAHIEGKKSVWVRKELQRGVALCWIYGKRDSVLQERCWDVVRKGIHYALNEGWIGVYLPFSELVRTRNRELIREFAPIFEQHAKRFAKAGHDYNPENAQSCYEIAGRLWERVGDVEALRRCGRETAEVLLVRASSSAQAIIRSEWMAKGIAKLRLYHGEKDRINALERELEEVRRSIIEEMQSHEFSIDLSSLFEHVRATIVGPETHDALMQLAFGIGPGPQHEHSRKSVLDGHEKYSFASMFSEIQYDESGVPVARRKAFDPSNEEQVYERMIREVRVSDTVIMARGILEGIDLLFEKFGVSFNEILRYVHGSPAIADGHEESMARGLMAGFNHDWLEVAAFLIPQVEAVVRNIFRRSGKRTLVDRGDSTEEEMSLNQLLESQSAVDVLGKDHVLQLRALLTERSGYNLRNLYAHGLLSDDAVHNDGIYNLWWVMLRLVLFVPWGVEWFQTKAGAVVLVN